MAKKSKKTDVDTGPAGELTHNPFAGLLGGTVTEGADVGDPGGDQAPQPPPASESGWTFPGKVVVRRQTKGRGGKTVTRVTGVTAAELDALAAEMKRALGCGAKVEDGDVLLLGDVADRAVAWLESAGARRVIRGS